MTCLEVQCVLTIKLDWVTKLVVYYLTPNKTFNTKAMKRIKFEYLSDTTALDMQRVHFKKGHWSQIPLYKLFTVGVGWISDRSDLGQVERERTKYVVTWWHCRIGTSAG